MAYITQQQLEDRYGAKMLVQLTDRGVPAQGLIDAAVVSRAIADTEALIDGYLTGRYALPLVAVPPLLTDIAGEIAIYKLHRKQADEKITRDHDNAMKRLAEISKGTIRLNASGVESPAASSSGVRTNEQERPFTNDSLKGFI